MGGNMAYIIGVFIIVISCVILLTYHVVKKAKFKRDSKNEELEKMKIKDL